MSDEKDFAQRKLEMIRGSLPVGIYQHYKGPYYTVFALSIKEDTCAILVHYYSHDHKTRWTRDISDFTANVEGHGTRFAYAREASLGELREAIGFTC